jgi:type II secretory pathway pseudopilin PulG
MKLHPTSTSARGLAVGAFTLSELMTVVAIFSLLVAATVAAQLFGLRMYRISENKLSVTANARSVLNHVRDEIRSGKYLYIGTGDASAFTPSPGNVAQAGNAIRICPSGDTNNYIYYYRDDGDSCLKRKVSNSAAVQVIARGITNAIVFEAEDYQGNVVTNVPNNRVVRVTLQFHQWDYALAAAGNGGLYECYRLQTAISRRSID